MLPFCCCFYFAIMIAFLTWCTVTTTDLDLLIPILMNLACLFGNSDSGNITLKVVFWGHILM